MAGTVPEVALPSSKTEDSKVWSHAVNYAWMLAASSWR